MMLKNLPSNVGDDLFPSQNLSNIVTDAAKRMSKANMLGKVSTSFTSSSSWPPRATSANRLMTCNKIVDEPQ